MVDALGNERLFGLLKTALDASSMGHQMNAANVANIDTPGYVARRMDFENIMRDFSDKEAMQHESPLKGGHSRSLPRPAVLNYQDYVVEEDTGHLTERFDGNNVDIDKEMAAMAKMRGRFQLASQLMNKKVHLINEVIMSGR